MSDRKYRQRGYQDSPGKEKRERPPQGSGRPPKQEQMGPRTPRMVGRVTRARCSNCGNVLAPGFDVNGRCSKCNAELHSCKQCMHFDTSARFECTQAIAEHIAKKDVRNECAFFSFRFTIEKDTSPVSQKAAPSPETVSRPSDARQAFENLFKK